MEKRPINDYISLAANEERSNGLGVVATVILWSTIIIMYSCCCRSAYAIDHAPTDAGGACKISSQRTRANLKLLTQISFARDIYSSKKVNLFT